MTNGELDVRDGRALERAVAELRSMHGPALRTVALYGEAATGAYLARVSPLLLAVVLESITPAALRATAGSVARWRRRRIGAPLLLDPPYIASARDVFPLEFLELSDRHRILFGEDPFAGLEIDLRSLRAEIEAQLRGKMLHLCEAYLESGGSRSAIEPLLVHSSQAFEVVMRGMLRLRELERPGDGRGLVVAVEGAFGLALPVLSELAHARAGARHIARAHGERLFDGYLDEVRLLVSTIDAL